MSGKKGRIIFWAGMAISLGFVAYAVTKMDFHKAASIIATVNPIWFVPIFAVHLLTFYFRAARWWYIMEPTRRVPVMTLLSGHCLGAFANMVMPMRIGELIRAYLVAKKAGIKTTSSLATIVVERAFDVLALLVLMILVMTFANPKSIPAGTWQDLRTGGQVIAVFLVAGFGTLYLLAGENSALSGFITRLIGRLPQETAVKGAAMYESFRGGLKALKKGGHLFGILVNNTMVWLCMFLFFYLFLPMFGLGYSLEMGAVLTLFIVFGVSVPSSPGFIGPFHAGVVLALGFYGIDPGSGLGIAIIIHLTSFIYVVIVGLFFLWREKLSFSEMRHTAD